MFFCEECRIERGWPGSILGPRSYGPCEVCRKTGPCHDVPSSALSHSKPVKMKELREEPEEPEEPERKSAWERISEND
jgi:hypothetical protein